VHEGDAGAPDSLAASDRPLRPEDVDRLLERAGAEPSSPAARRALRDDLTLAVAALDAAMEILAADVALLRHRLGASPHTGTEEDVEHLPDVLTARTWGPGWSAPGLPRGGEEPDPAILTRAAPLMTAHQVLATGLVSPSEVVRALERVETQLVALARRRTAAEARLAEVRAAIVAEWSTRVTRTLDTPA